MIKYILVYTAITATCAFADTVYVNLDVDTSKITGRSKGLISDKENLKKEAVKNALENKGSVLAGGNIFYETRGDSLEVTASGYPAKIVKTRPPKGGDFIPYLSVKQQISITEAISPFGGNIEIGGVIENFFISADFSLSWVDVGGGVSWGRVISNRDYLKVIIGGTAGCWLIAEDVFDGYGIVFGGFFMKTLFGTQRVKFEISNRILGPVFGINYQLGLGFTFTPFIGKR